MTYIFFLGKRKDDSEKNSRFHLTALPIPKGTVSWFAVKETSQNARAGFRVKYRAICEYSSKRRVVKYFKSLQAEKIGVSSC